MDIEYQLQDIRFQWDEDKAQSNVQKHGITFEEAAEVFFDPFRQTGDASTDNEQRDFILGYSSRQRILWVVYVERDKWTRIISARRATRHERKSYEDA
ncbi:MAG: BrnT family toxin [Gemmatimonadetes bacterium]|nr:BrnT family toxin [Gemmatimonadota bacterium]MXY81680.1 BrnT family toxin [Gemmatimonadota bacterium]MYB67156.1 BrnT family toxin [Gemmatimonadota bacterium]